MLIGSYTGRFAALAVSCLLISNTGVAADDVPRTIPYRGLLELNGSPVQGTKVLKFSFHRDAPDGNVVYSEHHSVAFSNGRFSVMLGEGTDRVSAPDGVSLADVISFRHDLYLRIAVKDPGAGDFVLLEGAQRLAPSAYSISAVGGDVPVGTVIDWWRPDTGTPIPHGYAVANGAVVDDPASPFNGKRLPDLAGKFILGVTDPNAQLVPSADGVAGGTAEHNHSVDLPAHAHQYSLDHNHPSTTLSIDSSGSHSHIWANVVNKAWYTGNGVGIGAWNNGYGNEGSGRYSPTVSSGSLYTDARGSHSHSGSVNLPNLDLVDATTRSHNQAPVSSATAGTMPPYVGLLKLVRIK